MLYLRSKYFAFSVFLHFVFLSNYYQTDKNDLSAHKFLSFLKLIMRGTIKKFQVRFPQRFYKSSKDHEFIAIYDKQDGNLKVAGSAWTSGARFSDSYDFQGQIHGVNSNRGLGAGIIVVKVVVLYTD